MVRDVCGGGREGNACAIWQSGYVFRLVNG